MGSELRVLEESRSGSGDANGGLLPLTVVKIDRFTPGAAALVCPMFHEAWHKLNHEDLSFEVSEITLGDVEVRMPAIEHLFYQFLQRKAVFVLGMRGAVPRSILVYNEVYPGIVAVRLLYVLDETHGVGKRLMDEAKPVKVLFQTQNEYPPERLLGVTASRREMVCRGDKLTTWMMDWRTQ